MLATFAQGVLAGLGYWVAGVQSPVFWGVTTAVVALIPFGAPLIWASIGVWLLLNGQLSAGFGLLLWGVLAVSWIDNLVRPLVIRGVAKTPFLLVLFGVLSGLIAFGLIGLFVGPVILAILLALWREWDGLNAAPTAPAPKGLMRPVARCERCALPQVSTLRWGSWLALLSLLGLLGCAPLRGYESLLVLLDAAAGAAPSRLKQVSPPPTRTPVAYTVDGRSHTADLYLPGAGAPAAAIVLVPGAVRHGKDDAQLVAFAQTLARARFAVLAPELTGLRQLRLHPGAAREVADAFVHLASRADLAPAGRVGIAAFSYAVGPALLAALEPDLRHQVRFILGVGGYHDLPRTVGYFTTGRFEHDARWHDLEPNPYGTLVLAKSSLPYLSAPDRAILKRMIEIRLQQRTADIAHLAPDLSPHGAAVYALLNNTEPGRVAQLLAALPRQLGADLAALSLHDKELAGLRARLILLHGKNDNLIPYPQSIALAAAVPPGQARLFLINRLLGHVDLSLGHLLSWQFLSRELPDAWRLWRAADALLAERAPDADR